MSTRGYFGVALYEPKTEANLGTVMRSAHNFGANFVCTIGHRYHKQAADVTDATKHVPLFHYTDLDDFLAHLPLRCELVRVEVDGRDTLPAFTHHERAVYLFGGEDRTLPSIDTMSAWPEPTRNVRIETEHCLNLAVAASLVLYDRQAKRRPERDPSQSAPGLAFLHHSPRAPRDGRVRRGVAAGPKEVMSEERPAYDARPRGETLSARDEAASLEAALRIVIEALDELMQGGPFAYVSGVTRFRSGLVMARELLDAKE